MEMTATECTLYAQVLPVFVLALIAESLLYTRGPAAKRWNPMIMFSVVIAWGCLATLLALQRSQTGSGAAVGLFIDLGAQVCIGAVLVFGAIAPFRDDIARRVLARWQAKQARTAKAPRPNQPRRDRGQAEEHD